MQTLTRYPINAPFLKDNHLVIQFIISSFVETFQTVRSLNSLESELSLDQALKESTLTLKNLNLSPLKKLKHYAQLFSRNTLEPNKTAFNFFISVHQTWLAAEQYQDISHSFKHIPSPDLIPDSFIRILARNQKNFQRDFRSLIKKIPSILKGFETNENVLHLLVIHKDTFESIYGENFYPLCFKSSGSITEKIPYILKRFEEREFEFMEEKILPPLFSPGTSYA